MRSEQAIATMFEIRNPSVAPVTNALLLNQRDGELKLVPVYWGMAQSGGQAPASVKCLSRYGTTGAVSVHLPRTENCIKGAITER